MDVREFMEDYLSHLSERPWSDYSESDYSLQQWHNACLIHIHDGPPTSKSQCKLPVKTPDGAINRNGVYAAAAALAGARGGLKAPPDQISSAASALRKLYKEMNAKPPPSLLDHSSVSHMMTDVSEITKTGKIFLEHFGVKGQKWGQRKSGWEHIDNGSPPSSLDARTALELKKRPIRTLSNQDLRVVNERMNLEQNFKRMNPSKVKTGEAKLKTILGTISVGVAAYNLLNSPAGKAALEAGKKALKKKK